MDHNLKYFLSSLRHVWLLRLSAHKVWFKLEIKSTSVNKWFSVYITNQGGT